ncbi:MAG: ABC transporter permease [Pseudomonadota bacterium]
MATVRDTLNDLGDGLRQRELWSSLAWNDIRARYERSILGPFWLALSMGFLVLSIGFVYGTIFKIALEDYFPYLTMGFIAWALISSFVNEGSGIFMEVAGLIRQIKVPISVHIARLTLRTLIIFAHNLVVFLVVALIFRIEPTSALLLAPLGIALVTATGAWVTIVLGILSVRYRDFRHLASSVLQFFFFLTPVIWQPDMLDATGRLVLTDFNPFFHAVELIRAPFLGTAPALTSWVAMILVTVGGWAVAIQMLRTWGRLVPFWI